MEKIHANPILRTLRNEGHLSNRQGRRVRGQDRLLWRGMIELLKDALLQIQILEDRLDRDVRVVARFADVEGRVDAVEGLLHLILADLILLHKLAEGPADSLHSSVEELRFDVPHPDLVAVQGRELRNPVAHLPRTDHRESHRRSRTMDGWYAVKGVVRKLLCPPCCSRIRGGLRPRSARCGSDLGGDPGPVPPGPRVPRATGLQSS